MPSTQVTAGAACTRRGASHGVLTRAPHGLDARLLVVLFVLHAGAALYHHFIQRGATLKRTW